MFESIFFFVALQDFEQKIDKIARGEDEDSWIDKIFSKYIKFADITEGVEDVEGLEPPWLDENTSYLKNKHETNQTQRISLDPNFQKDLQSNPHCCNNM